MHSQNVTDKESLISHIYKITIYFVKALQEGTPEKRKRWLQMPERKLVQHENFWQLFFKFFLLRLEQIWSKLTMAIFLNQNSVDFLPSYSLKAICV